MGPKQESPEPSKDHVLATPISRTREVLPESPKNATSSNDPLVAPNTVSRERITGAGSNNESGFESDSIENSWIEGEHKSKRKRNDSMTAEFREFGRLRASDVSVQETTKILSQKKMKSRDLLSHRSEQQLLDSHKPINLSEEITAEEEVLNVTEPCARQPGDLPQSPL